MAKTPGKLEELAAVEDIRRLMARYVRYADHKRFGDLAALFTIEGTMTPHDVAGNVLVEMRGRAEIEKSIATSVGSAQPIHHLFSSEITVVSPVTATAVWAMEDLVTYADDAADAKYKSMHGYGHYRAGYTKIDGDWLISDLNITRLQIDITPLS